MCGLLGYFLVIPSSHNSYYRGDETEMPRAERLSPTAYRKAWGESHSSRYLRSVPEYERPGPADRPRQRQPHRSSSRRYSNQDMDIDQADQLETAGGVPSAPRGTGPILFYQRDQPYYEFTNFSRHQVEYNGLIYPTSEHLFQAHKFLPAHPELAERIRNLPSSREALQEATRLRRLARSDWFDINIGVMENVLYAKFTQHPSLNRLLKDTGDRELIEDSPVDAFWGIGNDGQGRNELGKALMRLRAKL